MKYLVVLVFFFSFFPAWSQTKVVDSLIAELEQALKIKQKLEKQKWEKIANINAQLLESEQKKELLFQHQACEKLFEEYKSFVYDSAFKYTNHLLASALALKDARKINEARTNLSFILLSSGMFKEALDTLSIIDSLALPVESRINFYKVYARTYYDLSDFSQDQHYNSAYSAQGNEYLTRAIQLADKKSSGYLFLMAWEDMRYRNTERAIQTFLKLLNEFKLTENEYAICTSSLSFMYKLNNQMDKSKEYLAKAAIADIRGSVRETVAMRDLAEILFKEGDQERAHRYVKIALADAYFYGAKFRKVQIAHILPIIEAEQMNLVESKRKTLLVYSLLATIGLIIIIMLAVIGHRKNQALKLTQEALTKSHQSLQELNSKLLDANVIKEEYIGHFFKTISEYIDKIDKFKSSIDRKIMQKKPEEIRDIVNRINLKAEREQLYGSFDSIFLKIFPGFIDKFNALLNKEDWYQLDKDAPLPPELRIFALIRLGITDNEKIALILGYSVNTIYTYKTRIKNKALVSNEKFEEKVMEIKAHN